LPRRRNRNHVPPDHRNMPAWCGASPGHSSDHRRANQPRSPQSASPAQTTPTCQPVPAQPTATCQPCTSLDHRNSIRLLRPQLNNAASASTSYLNFRCSYHDSSRY
jgi:hypothetical protein